MNYVHKSKEQLAQELEALQARVQELEAVTSYSALERLLLELQERNEALDIFTRVVTFDVKNALGFIGSFSKTLVDMYPTLSEADVRRYLGAILERAEKAALVVDELLLLDTVRQVDTAPAHRLAMEDIVSAALEQVADLLAAHQTEVFLPDAWPEVLGQPVLVQELWALYLSDLLRYGGEVRAISLGYDQATLTELPEGSYRLSRRRKWGREKNPPDGQVVQRRKFWVWARGSSLSVEQLTAAFQKYASLETTIIQHIMDKLDGCAGIEVHGTEARLFFTLPVPSDDPA